MRTAPLVKKDELDIPGPAHYQKGTGNGGESSEGSSDRPIKFSHMFASTTGRLYTPPKIVTVSCKVYGTFCPELYSLSKLAHKGILQLLLLL